MSTHDKPLVWLHGEVKSPPFSHDGRREAGLLLRLLQRGHIDRDAIVILDVFEKKTPKTPQRMIDVCRERMKRYDGAVHERGF
jgi:hypothetical protein